jgi:hypothetical protein
VDGLCECPIGERQLKPDKDGLARIVEADGGRDDAENSYYEEAADPGFVRLEKRGAGSAVSTSVA